LRETQEEGSAAATPQISLSISPGAIHVHPNLGMGLWLLISESWRSPLFTSDWDGQGEPLTADAMSAGAAIS
jgi:hypothetical protein